MLNFKPKPKDTHKREKANDLKILNSIQRYKRNIPEKIPSSFFTPRRGRNFLEEKENSNSQTQNIGSVLGSYTKGSRYSKTGNVTLSCVPALITASQTRSILHSSNFSSRNSQVQNDHIPVRPSQTRPMSRNARSTWAICSSDFVKRNGPSNTPNAAVNLLEAARQTYPQVSPLNMESFPKVQKEIPIVYQKMVRPPGPGLSASSLFGSTINDVQKASSVSNNCVVQGSWVDRTSKRHMTAVTDPKVTVKYSLAELIDILCGFAPVPEKGMFVHPEKDNAPPPPPISDLSSIFDCEASLSVSSSNGNGTLLKSNLRPLRRQLLPDFERVSNGSLHGTRESALGINDSGGTKQVFGPKQQSSSSNPRRVFFSDEEPETLGQKQRRPYFDDILPSRTSFGSTGQPNDLVDNNNDIRDVGIESSVFDSRPNTTPFSITVKDGPLSLFDETYNGEAEGFKIPRVPASRRSSFAPIFQSPLNKQNGMFLKPYSSSSSSSSRSFQTHRSSAKRKKSEDISKHRKNKLPKFDIFPKPMSYECDETVENSNRLSRIYLGNSAPLTVDVERHSSDSILPSPTKIDIPIPIPSSSSNPNQNETEFNEVSPYAFGLNINNASANESYLGGLGIIQTHYSTLNYESQSQHDNFADPFA